jgi:hypothetical protein
MAKGQSPLLGYNTNVRHKGRVFHIQTEDSGVQHPHVITHLFADGGRIIKSNKTGYAELLDAPDWQAQVKKIMQDQHKAMFIALRDGQFDHLIDPTGADAKTATIPDTPPGSTSPAARPADLSGAVPAAQPPRAPSVAAMPAVAPLPPTPAGVPGPPRPASLNAMPAVRPPTAPQPATPPAAVAPSASAPAASVPVGNADRSGPTTAQRSPSGTGRYGPVRAPEILGSFKSKPNENASIFGDGLMSEKSLDEVILAYLAEDLDDTKR